MAILNVTQPDGGNALFNTVTDKFVAFNAGIREFSDFITWEDALEASIGATMNISEDIEQAIALCLVPRDRCEQILQILNDDFDKYG